MDEIQDRESKDISNYYFYREGFEAKLVGYLSDNLLLTFLLLFFHFDLLLFLCRKFSNLYRSLLFFGTFVFSIKGFSGVLVASVEGAMRLFPEICFHDFLHDFLMLSSRLWI